MSVVRIWRAFRGHHLHRADGDRCRWLRHGADPCRSVLDQAYGAPTLAGDVKIGAFNLGDALSAWLGGLVISAGLGYTAPNWVGAALAAG
ncbi:hypothetical protein SALBM311S_07453 [Streptomyces alboniger]